MRLFRQLSQNAPLLCTLLGISWFVGCSTPEVRKESPVVPEILKAPHPTSYDTTELEAMLADPAAPKDPEFYKKCDEDFRKLKAKTPSLTEQRQGMVELIHLDSLAYHWLRKATRTGQRYEE
jgi:hypothetical protein